MKPYLQTDWNTVKESGLLSSERIAFLENEVTRRTRPLVVDGKDISTARLMDYPDKTVVITVESQGGYSPVEYHQRSLIAALLTADELKLINDEATRAWSEHKEAADYEKATKISDLEHNGGVWWGDDYFSDLDELYDRLVSDCDNPEDIPEYVWAAAPTEVIPAIGVDDVVEHYLCDRGWEDMSTDDLEGVTELQAALDRFTEANQGVVSYHPDHKTAVVISPQTRAELAAQMVEMS